MNKLESMVINESGFAFDPFTGETYTINECGLHILHRLKSGLDVPEIVTELTKEFEVSFDKAYSDLLEFKNLLRNYGLMRGDA